jgi:hypothetical protein
MRHSASLTRSPPQKNRTTTKILKSLEDSSMQREARALELAAASPPVSPAAILSMLGDTGTAAYAPPGAKQPHPIYRAAPGDPGVDCDPMSLPLRTLSTALLDSDARRVDVLVGNPAGDAGAAARQFYVDLDTMAAVEA